MQKPTQLDPLAETILDRLRLRPESAEIVLGGYFGLHHYLAYRKTHDIDAWWRGGPSRETAQAIREVMQEITAPAAPVRDSRCGGGAPCRSLRRPDLIANSGRRAATAVAFFERFEV
jgi:hypothetical protein